MFNKHQNSNMQSYPSEIYLLFNNESYRSKCNIRHEHLENNESLWINLLKKNFETNLLKTVFSEFSYKRSFKL